MPVSRVQLERSNVSGFVPNPSALEVGQLFLNMQDRALFSKDLSDIVFQLRNFAGNVSYDPVVSGLAAQDVQTAIDELDEIVDQIANTGVLNFNGRTGSVLPEANDYNINQLSDVDTVTIAPDPGDVLTWDGSNWVPQAVFNVISANGFIELPQAKSYTIISDAVAAATILKLVGRTGAGSVNVAVAIDGTPVTGLSGAMTTIESSKNATANNSVSIGQRVTITCSSPVAVQNLEFTLTLQR